MNSIRVPSRTCALALLSALAAPAWADDAVIESPVPVIETAPEAAAEPEPPAPTGPALPGRALDPVAFRAKVLGDEMRGAKLSGIRVFAMQGGAPKAVVFQIDERSDDGQLILTAGDGAGEVKDEDGDWVRALNLGYLTDEDEVIVRAVDAGPKGPGAWEETPLAAAKHVAEVVVTDPDTDARGYFYVARFEAEAPPPADGDFIRYGLVPHPEHEGFEVEHVWTPRYHVAFSDPDAPFAYSDLRISPSGNGKPYGPDLLDAFRFLIYVNPFYISFTFRTDDIAPERVGYIDGPLRVTRRIHLGVKLWGIPLPEFLIRALTDAALDTDSFYYPDYFFFEANMAIPRFLIERGEDSYGVFATDFTRAASGGRFLNDRNRDVRARVDGRMSDAERNLNREFSDWNLVATPNGGWMNILRFGDAFRDVRIRLHYVDNAREEPDEDEADRPEFRRAYGSTGYYVDEFHKTDPEGSKKFEAYVFTLPPDFTVGDEAAYARIVQRPLVVSPE